jgi:hypothetical protein
MMMLPILEHRTRSSEDQSSIPTRLVLINKDGDFRGLMEELKEEFEHTQRESRDAFNSESIDSFWHNRRIKKNEFKIGNLFGLCLAGADLKGQSLAHDDTVFVRKSETAFLLPIFALVDRTVLGTQLDVIWTHPRARGNGYASNLIQLLNVSIIYNPLEKSIPFWRKYDDDQGFNKFKFLHPTQYGLTLEKSWRHNKAYDTFEKAQSFEKFVKKLMRKALTVEERDSAIEEFVRNQDDSPTTE